MIAAILRNMVQIAGVLWLGIAGFGLGLLYEHRPAGWPNLALGPCPVCVHVGFGSGPFAERDAARAAFATEKASLGTVLAALRRQNAAVALVAAAGRNARAEAETAVAQGRAGMAAANRQVQALQQPIAGADECERVRDVDRRFVGGLSQ